MAKTKKIPNGLVIEELLATGGWDGDGKEPKEMSGSVASIWTLQEGSNTKLTIDELVACLKAAKEQLGNKYKDVHVKLSLVTEEDDYGHDHTKLVFNIMGKRMETAAECKKRWQRHLSRARLVRHKWEQQKAM